MNISTTQPIHPLTIIFMRAIRFLQVGAALHLTTLAGVFILFLAGERALDAWNQDRFVWGIGYSWLAIGGWFVLLCGQLDAFSRYQNYKKAKDLFHKNGVTPRVIQLFVYSRCQRGAMAVAARDLGLREELARYFQDLGYQWYHILPDFIYTTPQILFARRYWQRTLFEKPYRSKYFLW